MDTIRQATVFRDSQVLNAPRTEFYDDFNNAPYGALSQPVDGH